MTAVPGFLPSANGLQFANRFPSGPTAMFGPIDPRWFGIGDASAGLCGGMSWYVRERFEGGMPIPVDTDPPVNGSPLFQALVRRQVQSLDWLRLPLRFYDLSAFRPRFATWLSGLRPPLGELVRDREWPRVRAEIDAGRLATLGLVRAASANPLALTANHQVLAYGYRVEPSSVAVRVYDPNWPDRDDVEERMILDQGAAPRFESSTGEPLLGFFLAPYAAVYPKALGSSWASVWAPAKRSPTFATRSRMSRMVQRFGRRVGSSSSFQAMGAETGAPAEGRTAYGATSVLIGSFWV
jgi:hypothetical protein